MIAGLGAGPPTVYAGTAVEDGVGLLAEGVADGVGAALAVAATVGGADGTILADAATAELPG